MLPYILKPTELLGNFIYHENLLDFHMLVFKHFCLHLATKDQRLFGVSLLVLPRLPSTKDRKGNAYAPHELAGNLVPNLGTP